MGQDEDSSISERKIKGRGNKCKGTHHLPQADKCSASLKATATSPKALSFYCWAWCYSAWNNLSVSLDQLSQLYPSPTSLLPTTSSLEGQSGEKRKSILFYRRNLTMALIGQCLGPTFLAKVLRCIANVDTPGFDTDESTCSPPFFVASLK